MNIEQRTMFCNVIARFQSEYPKREIHLVGSMVYIDGEIAFNTDGYNLLYCLTMLCRELKDELI